MLKYIKLIFLLITVATSAQSTSKLFFLDFVECCYSKKTTEPISLYKKPNGNIVKKLNPLTDLNCWYKFAISESKDNWLKIENIIVLPGCTNNKLNVNINIYKGRWVHSKNMILSLPDSSPESGLKYNFYTNPDKKSKIIISLDSYLSLNLIEVSGTWAKVNFAYNKKEYSGWLERKYQCPYLWTTCPIYE